MKALIIYNPRDRSNGKGIAIATQRGTYVDHGGDDTVQIFEAEFDRAEFDRLRADPRIEPIAVDADIDAKPTREDKTRLDSWLQKNGGKEVDVSAPTRRELAKRMFSGTQRTVTRERLR